MKTYKVMIQKGEYDTLFLVVFAKNAKSAEKKVKSHIEETAWAQHSKIVIDEIKPVNGVIEVIELDF